MADADHGRFGEGRRESFAARLLPGNQIANGHDMRGQRQAFFAEPRLLAQPREIADGNFAIWCGRGHRVLDQ